MMYPIPAAFGFLSGVMTTLLSLLLLMMSLSCLRSEGTEIGHGNIEIPLEYKARAKAATSNPVAVAMEFQVMIENILSTLIGKKPSLEMRDGSKQVRTWYYADSSDNCPNHKGIVGHVTAFFAMIETQVRGALYLHCLIWGGLSPKLLEGAAGIDCLCKEIQEALDTMYTASALRECMWSIKLKSA